MLAQTVVESTVSFVQISLKSFEKQLELKEKKLAKFNVNVWSSGNGFVVQYQYRPGSNIAEVICKNFCLK